MRLEELNAKFQALEELTGHVVSPGWRRVFAALLTDDTDDAGLTDKEREMVELAKTPEAPAQVKQTAEEIKDSAPGEHPSLGTGPATMEPARPPWQEPRRR